MLCKVRNVDAEREYMRKKNKKQKHLDRIFILCLHPVFDAQITHFDWALCQPVREANLLFTSAYGAELEAAHANNLLPSG